MRPTPGASSTCSRRCLTTRTSRSDATAPTRAGAIVRSCASCSRNAARRWRHGRPQPMHNAPMKIGRPSPTEYDAAFERYVKRVPEDDALPALSRQPGEIRAAVGALPPERAGYRYAAGKWSIRELIGHVTDSERVFGYRALCVARGES